MRPNVPRRKSRAPCCALTFCSLDAFRFIDAGGASHLVRWSIEPTLSPTPVPHAALASMGPDFLEHDLVSRLANGTATVYFEPWRESGLGSQ